MSSFQDWDKVVLSKPKRGTQSLTEQDINKARRKGEVVESEEKHFAARNLSTLPPKNAKKLEEDTGDYHVDTVTHDFAKALQVARMNKKMTQAQLAQQVNEKATVINDYEAGRAIPNGQVVQKLQRVLGCKLPAARVKSKSTVSD